MPKKPFDLFAFGLVVSIAFSGCASAPYRGVNPENPQFERGYQIPPIDFLANLLALPYKLLFWSWRLQNHQISAMTEEELQKFMKQHEMRQVKVYITKFALFPEMQRLFTDSIVAWPYRIFPGFFSTLISGLTDWLIGGDYYNPFTNSIHLFSDDRAVALHEAGHALDFQRRTYRGTYAMMRLLPAADTYQEWIATEEAIGYFKEHRSIHKEVAAYKILYPAYGSYVGGAFSVFVPIPYLASTLGIIVGHIWGRAEAGHRWDEFHHMEAREKEYFSTLNQQPIKP